MLSLVAAFLAVAATPGPQTRQDPSIIKVETERVLIDVMVFDKRGDFVKGLTADDFEVYENGVRRPVANLLFIDKAAYAQKLAATAGTAAPLPPAEAEQYQDQIVVVLDRVSTSLAEYRRALEGLRQLIGNLPKTAKLAIFVFDGKLEFVQPFTDRPEELLDALKRIEMRQPLRALPGPRQVYEEIASLFTERQALGFQITDTTSMQSLVRGALRDGIQAANRHLALVDLEVRGFLRSLRNLAKSLAYVPGSKVLLLFSRGYSMKQGDEFRGLLRDQIQGRFQSLGSGFERSILIETNQVANLDYQQEFADLIGLCNLNQLRFYTVDPRGLVSLPGGGDPTQSSSFFQLLNRPDRQFFRDLRGLTRPVDSLILLARETNGLPFYNRNDIGQAVEQVVTHNQRYYLIAYQPTTGRDERKFYRIKVRLKDDPGYKVFAEKGYRFTREDRSKKELEYALAFPGLYRQIPVSVATSTFYQPEGPVTTLSVEIPGSRVPFTVVDDTYCSDLEIRGFFLDKRGNEAHRFAGPFPLRMSRSDYVSYRGKSFIYYQEARLPPGAYQLRTLVRDRRSGLIGAYLNTLQVPERGERLSMSDVVLSQDVRIAEEKRSGPLYVGNHRIVPEGDLSVRAGEPALIFFHIYNLGRVKNVPRASVSLRIEDSRGDLIHQGRDVPIRSFTRGGMVAFSQPLGPVGIGLLPGAYRLRIRVNDHVSGTDLKRELKVECEGSRDPSR